jgi:hypothetical protein
MNEKKINWKPTCKRFVAYMDIMGFQNLVLTSTHQEVLDIMEKFRIPIKKLKQEAEERESGRHKGWDTFKNSIVKPVIFSDSVILFSNDDSEGAFENITWQATEIVSNALISGLPIKGTIAHGEQTADTNKSLYFGKPLIDAWELQNELLMYSIVLHHTTERYLAENGWIENFENAELVKYNTPLKTGKVKHYLVDWPVALSEFSKTMDSIPNLYYHASGSVRRYIDNTLDYYVWRNPPQTNKK